METFSCHVSTDLYDSRQPGFETVEDCERCLFALEACTSAIASALGEDIRRSPANVVDLACGVGEPGLTLLAAHGDWRLTGVDLSSALISAARRHAEERNVGGRTRFVTASMDALPIADASVDAVISRMGALLLGDPATTAGEIARVLRPGGRCAIAVWARAEDHPLLVLSYRAVTTHVASEELPDLFTWFGKMAAAGVREGWLRDAGLTEASVETFEWRVHYPDFEACWDLGWAIWGGSLAAVDEQTVGRMRSTMRGLLEPYASSVGAGYVIPAVCQLVRGTK